MSNKKNEKLSFRLAEMITQLNYGARLDTHQLAEQYKTSLRTIQRDLGSRLAMLDFQECGPRYYSLDKNKLGHLSNAEIQRLAHFASIQNLFPEADRRFFQEKLHQSIQVKGFQYEDIRSKLHEFDTISHAIENHQYIEFSYSKVGQDAAKHYRLAPYHMVNKNGIWYVVGVDEHKQKTYCFSQITQLKLLEQTFEPDNALQEQIRQTDSIFYGNQISEIIIKVHARAAGYFIRRALLPNQETIRQLEDGSLLLACKNINPMEVVPIVQYWIPHLRIISPSEIQQQLEKDLEQYLHGL